MKMINGSVIKRILIFILTIILANVLVISADMALQIMSYNPSGAVIAIIICFSTLIVFILSWRYMLRHTGLQKADGSIRINWFDRLYGDVLLVVLLILFIETTYQHNWGDKSYAIPIVEAGYMLIGILLLSYVRRRRYGILLSQNLTSNILVALKNNYFQIILFRKAVLSLAVVSLLIVIMQILLVGCQVDSLLTYLLIILPTILIYLPVFRWIIQFQAVSRAIENVGLGPIQPAIPYDQLSPDLRRIIDSLVNIDQRIQIAIAEQMKSERMKTDLITNVSHDLKTPITSFINYLDLLKQTEDPSKRVKYLGILEQKSQRLKTLTEDLTEAAKASSGNLSIGIEPVNLNELVNQAAGEYADKFRSGGLTLIVNESNDAEGNVVPVIINSDGHHIWRIMDNLMSNACKYSQKNTRIFIDLKTESGQIKMIIKNTSREILNCSADELQQRFVRGDESRHSEGSGLGLAIATSLAELLGGSLSIELDGDLFKVIIFLPVEK